MSQHESYRIYLSDDGRSGGGGTLYTSDTYPDLSAIAAGYPMFELGLVVETLVEGEWKLFDNGEYIGNNEGDTHV